MVGLLLRSARGADERDIASHGISDAIRNDAIRNGEDDAREPAQPNTGRGQAMTRGTNLRSGDWVKVKSKSEILATLDKNGKLDGLPFMPEMFEYCGRRLQVSKRAHKTCDPPSGLASRRMASAVHLDDVRCDGSAHGGCQAGCLIFWKGDWLEAVDDRPIAPSPASAGTSGCEERDVFLGTQASGRDGGESEPVYVCQSTEIAPATVSLAWWDLRQYVEDYTSGNVKLRQLFAGLLFTVYQQVAEAGIGIGSPMRWAYDRFQKMRGGAVYPLRPGRIAPGSRTPAATLNLQPGELVRVKKYDEILGTLNDKWHNRGMYFDAEQVIFCGRTYEVLMRVEKQVDERTGKMLDFNNDAIILKDVVCEARYAKCRRFCPRRIYPYWREIWLERVVGDTED